MVIKVGINGFGRIGRIITRTCLQNSDLQVAAINDPAITSEYICYLLKFDSTHGKLKNNIKHYDNLITVDDLQIKVFHETLPPSIPWQTAGVEYVVESSGMFASLNKASGHLESNGVKRVIVTAPSTDVPMIILGVNEHILSPGQKVISCASSTLYCLAPIIKILEDNFGVSEGFMTSIHAMTPSLKPLDGLCLRGKHWRDHRSIHQNIIPAATGACKALGKIIPQVKDKLSGLAFRVPIVDVSVLDLCLRLSTSTNLQDIVKAVEKCSLTNMATIIKVTNEETVSSDFMGERYSCIFDVNCSIQLKPNFYKIVCWYENEYSYACRVIDSIFFTEKQQCYMEYTPMLRYIVSKTDYKRDEMLQTDTVSLHVSVTCDCNNRISKSIGSSEIFYPANSVSPQTSSGHLTLKKPLQGGSVPSCNKKKINNGIFSLCRENNNTTATPVDKQSGESFFQSCTTFSSSKSTQNGCLNAKERLDKLRREFSKMINITEDFMKKTNRSESNNRLSAKANTIKKILNNSNFNACKKSIEMKPVGDLFSDSKDLKESGNIVEKNDHSIFVARTRDVCESNVNQRVMPESENDLETSKDFKGKFANAEDKVLITNIVDNLKQNIQVGVAGVLNELQIKDVNSELSITDVEVDINYNDINPIVTEQTVKSALRSVEFRQFKSPTAKNIHIFDQELKKRNIVLTDIPFTIESSVDINESKGISEPQDNKNVSSVRILNGFHQPSPETVVVFSEGTSGRASPDQRERQDVYDKLDSESETDSNNSFDIHGKKSQIIQITDLTNSLEDLTRLDKICRIIEISDELSDDLFSNLDNEGIETKNKRWSFKDLCDKIKLDEFCNKVFGSCV